VLAALPWGIGTAAAPAHRSKSDEDTLTTIDDHKNINAHHSVNKGFSY
jgi:hypothetical protein